MTIQKKLFTAFLSLACLSAVSQTSWFAADSLSVLKAGTRQVLNPWAGGLNAIQYSRMHLDNDGVEDLVVFDRTTSKITTFLGDEQLRAYRYRPEFEVRFPAVTNWMLLVDYDGDGHKDLFTYVAQGIRVYRQQRSGTGDWHWEMVQPFLRTRGLSGNLVNLQVVAADIPALVDFDGDGDMDIISFEIQGDYAELNQNMSMEKYGVPDSLEFVRNGVCWGNFVKHFCEDFTLGIDCGVADRLSQGDNARVMHSGNSMLLHDLNGDGKKDLLLGHVSCENLSLLQNTAEGIAADFTAFTADYPAGYPVRLPVFPAAYLEDIDFDGVKDLLVSPNVYANDGNVIDFSASSWMYHNAGTDTNPDFVFRQKDFLQDDMLDVGESAAPSFFDIDGDGDLDLLIGSAGKPLGDAGNRGAFWYIRNTGTPGAPVFEVVSEDYLGLSGVLTFSNVQPQWADFNGDGRVDLGVAGIADRRLRFLYIPNLASPGQPVQLEAAQAVHIGLPPELLPTDKPYFYDADKDGDLDLLVGGTLGNISYYENTGSAAQPEYVLRTNTFAGVNPNFSGRQVSLAVTDADLDGKPDLLTADISGKVKVFHGADWGGWARRDTAVIHNQLTRQAYAPALGNSLHVAVADYDGDGKPDLAVGTLGGGINLFRNILPVTVTGTDKELALSLSPNPAHDQVSLLASAPGEVQVFDLTGRAVFPASLRIAAGIPLVISARLWHGGLYFVRIVTDEGTSVTKKLLVY